MENVKLTLGQIEGLLNTKELRDVIKMRIPSVSSFRLAKIVKNMEEEYKLFSESKQSLLNSYAARDDDDKIITNKAGAPLFKDATEINKELGKLANEEFDTGVEQLELKLKNCPEQTTAQEIMILLNFVKDPENFDKEGTEDEPVV